MALRRALLQYFGAFGLSRVPCHSVSITVRIPHLVLLPLLVLYRIAWYSRIGIRSRFMCLNLLTFLVTIDILGAKRMKLRLS